MDAERDIDQIIPQAQGPIDRKLLTGTSSGGFLQPGYFDNGPLLEYLPDDQQLEFLVENKTKGLTIEREGAIERVEPDRSLRAAALITDQATRFIVGQSGWDKIFDIPHREVTHAESTTWLFKQTFHLHTADATYTFPATRNSPVTTLVEYITACSNTSEETQRNDLDESSTTDTPEADGGQRSPSNHWHLPPPHTLEEISEDAQTHIEAAQAILASTAEPTRAELVRTHAELCTALEDLSHSEHSISESLSAGVDRLETHIQDGTTPSITTANINTNPDSPKVQSTAPTKGGERTNPEAGQEINATSKDADSTGTPHEDMPEESADDHWREALVADLQQLDESCSQPVDRDLIAEQGNYEAVDYESAFGDLETALAEAGLTTNAEHMDTPVSKSEPDDLTGSFEFNHSETTKEGVAELSPNELTEYYEALRILQTTTEQLLEHLDTQAEMASRKWYQEVYRYCGGEGPSDAPNYGVQQRDRNNFSIHDYREAYGNGDRITDFHHIELKPIDGVTKDILAKWDVVLDEDRVIPVAPESQEPLPLIVRNEAELASAKELLSEFPAYPDADEPRPSADTGEAALPDGRVESVRVTVLDEYDDPGAKRDAWLSVETEHGQQMPLVIWATHGIDEEWEVGAEYTLFQPRHKVWTTEDGTTHELSSTKDLTIEKESGGTAQDRPGGIIGQILDDVEL